MGLDAEDAEAGDCQMMLITLRKQCSHAVRAKWLSNTFQAEAANPATTGEIHQQMQQRAAAYSVNGHLMLMANGVDGCVCERYERKAALLTLCVRMS